MSTTDAEPKPRRTKHILMGVAVVVVVVLAVAQAAVPAVNATRQTDDLTEELATTQQKLADAEKQAHSLEGERDQAREQGKTAEDRAVAAEGRAATAEGRVGKCLEALNAVDQLLAHRTNALELAQEATDASEDWNWNRLYRLDEELAALGSKIDTADSTFRPLANACRTA
jgi:chromosome segregation ATPase